VHGLALQEGQHCPGQQRPLYYHPGPDIKATDRLLGQGVWLHCSIQPISISADSICDLRKSGLDIANLTFVREWLHILDLDGERVNAWNNDLCRPWTTTTACQLPLRPDQGRSHLRTRRTKICDVICSIGRPRYGETC